MPPTRLGAYQLGEELVSSAHLVEYRAVKVDDGATGDPVFLCGLRQIASSTQRRTRVTDALRKLRDEVTLPNCPRILDVIQYGKRSEFDVGVVSEFSEGCSLESLFQSADHRLPDPKLTLHILSTLCATVTAFHRHPVTGGQGVGLGALSTSSVWINRQAGLMVHNPFFGLALVAARSDNQAAKARQGDVQALQEILRQLTAPQNPDDEDETNRPEQIQGLLELSPTPEESPGDYAERFADAVDGVASEYGAGWAVAVVGLAAFDTVFDAQGVVSPATDGGSDARDAEDPSAPDAPVSAPVDRDETAAVSEPVVAPGPPEARPDDAAPLPLHAFPAEPDTPAPEPAAGGLSSRAKMVMAGFVVIVGIGAFLLGDFLARQGPPSAGGGAAEVDLRNVTVDPPDARLYLDVSDTDQVLTLPDGVHELEVRADGHESMRLSIEVRDGQVITIPASIVLPSDRNTTFGYLDLAGLTVEPDDAVISVDGENILEGVTQVLTPGLHTLSVTRDGFVPETQDITIEPGQTVTLEQTITLTAEIRPAVMTVSAEIPVQILENGRVLGTAPLSASVQPGAHTFEFRHEDLSVELAYDVQPGAALAISLQVVRVNSQPFGEVAIVQEGGVPVAAGTTPGRVLVPVGASLLFTHPQFDSLQIVPEPGQSAVSVSFR